MCSLPKNFGTCLTVSIRFYHDPDTGTCKKFRYSGCGGNGNNFLNGEDCVRTCGGLLETASGGVSALSVQPPRIIKSSSIANTLNKSKTHQPAKPTPSTTTQKPVRIASSFTLEPNVAANSVDSDSHEETVRSSPTISRFSPAPNSFSPTTASSNESRLRLHVRHRKRPPFVPSSSSVRNLSTT